MLATDHMVVLEKYLIIFDWEQMCNVCLPIPSLEEQMKIVQRYKIISERIELKRKINDNLAA